MNENAIVLLSEKKDEEKFKTFILIGPRNVIASEDHYKNQKELGHGRSFSSSWKHDLY